MATDGAALVENTAGITFGVELYIPWDAPEAVVDIQSEGVVPLWSIMDVIGLVGRRSDAAESRILQGRDTRNVRVLVPDPWGLDHCRHGGCAGVVCFHTGIVVASSAVAICGPQSHGVAPSGTRGDACGSQAAIPSDSAE